ncbi:MAG: hypothetical protein WCJ35_03745 [Planctomycetota bacterium]
MKKLLLLAVVLSIFVISLFAPSGARAANPPKKAIAPKAETYLVIKVTDDNKTENEARNRVEYKAITKSQFKDEQKRAADDYKLKMKEWHDLKKTDPTAPMPKKIKIEKIQSDYETLKVAQEYVRKLTEEGVNKDDQKPKDNRN